MEKPHIYVVDDDDAFRKSLKRLLCSIGYFAEVFSSAQCFLDSVSDYHQKDLLILDLRMPGMDGFQLQKKLKELRSEMDIIFITADARTGDRDHAIRSGAIGFLQKPFQDESLLDLIKQAMEIEKANNK